MKRCLLLLTLMAFSSFGQEKITMTCRQLRKKYADYDTAFFSSLAGEFVALKWKQHQFHHLEGDFMSPVLDWSLNKRTSSGEYRFERKNRHITLEIFSLQDSLSFNYYFVVTGDKPRICFKKGANNYYKVQKLRDLTLVKSGFEPDH